MFRRLQIQMTIFSTLVTGGILAFMTLACLGLSERGILETELASFRGNAVSCLSFLEGQEILSQTWVAGMQENHQIRMELRDNGRLLFQRETAGKEKRDPLFVKAARLSREEEGLDVENPGMVSQRKEAVFSMKEGYVCTALLPREGGILTGILIYDRGDQRERIIRQRMAFGGLSLLALFCLFAFSWSFTGRLIQPLKDSKEKQTAFIAAASHELRSPLAVILASIQAMEGAGEQEKNRFLGNIRKESQRMARLIQDMLSLANADNHSWQISMGPQELDTLLLTAYETFEPVMQEKGIRLSIELPGEETSCCLCDGPRIAQILSVLLDNGASYVPKGGSICLRLQEEREQFVIQVADNGPGIPREQQEEVFQRFYRMDTARKDKQHFGLGLSIAREIASLHGGSLRAGDTPGGGTTFTLTLPKKRE